MENEVILEKSIYAFSRRKLHNIDNACKLNYFHLCKLFFRGMDSHFFLEKTYFNSFNVRLCITNTNKYQDDFA